MTDRKKNVLLSSAFIMTMLAMMVTTLKANRAAMTYPYALMGFVVFFSFILLMQNLIKNQQPEKEVSADNGPSADKGFKRKALMLIAVCCAAMLGYIISIGVLGYLLSTFLFMVIVMFYLQERKWYRLLLVPAGMAGFLYALFSMVLKVTLPAGTLFGG